MFEVNETKDEEVKDKEVKETKDFVSAVREVLKSEKEGVTKVVPEANVYNPAGEKKVTIMIEEQEGDENTGDVFVSVNGHAWQIRRGFEVEVPESVVHVLKNAVITKMIQDRLTDEIKYKDVPRFNFRIIK